MGAATLTAGDTFAQLKPILEDKHVVKFGHAIKPTLNLLRNHGVLAQGVAFDTQIAGWLLDPAAVRLDLDEVALNHLNLRDPHFSSSTPAPRKKKGEGEALPNEDTARRTALNADYTWRLAHALTPRIREAGLEPLLNHIEMPLIGVLADMEWTGIRVDGDFLRNMSGKLEKQLAEQEESIYALAGEKFNIGSPKQLGTILFEKLALDSKGTTATGQASTSEEVLLALGKVHELPRKILDYRQASKLKSTYVDALPQMILPATGRIHATFNQTGAETGRLSSNDPNLQNIPIRGELGRTIRQAFKPGTAGWKILSADYSQIELRILAHYCQDATLLAAFEKGVDIHTAVAATLNKIPQEAVTREQRSQAKAVNFGILYGQTAFGLAATLGIGRREAQTIIEAYFAQHPGVRKCIDDIVARAKEQGYVTTVLGRRRFIPQLRASDRGARMMGERLAVNTIFQGSAADLIKKAMIEIHAWLHGRRAKLLLQIHDELLFETPADDADELRGMVKSLMEGALKLKVPLIVETGLGDDWLSAK
jgi:DNA polymerase-1